MASYTVKKRKKADGTLRYLCTVKVKEKGAVVYNKSRTFSKSNVAHAHGKKRVGEIEENGYKDKGVNVYLRELIQKLIEDQHSQLGRTKRKVLEMLSDCDIGSIKISDIESQHIINHCKARKETGTLPQTINHDVSYLRWSLKAAKPRFGYEVNDQCVIDAYPSLHDLKLIGKSNRRTRRPTSEELDKLRGALEIREQHSGSTIPYIDILDFSILTCMRIGEVCSIRWEDVNGWENIEERSVMVQNRKDPRKKAGNHMVVPLLGNSWDILRRQPKENKLIFPYNSRSVTAGFQRVRNAHDIKDLRYHDLRREGASRLFEEGYTIDEVAQVTGHRNINTLWQIYTELFPNRIHDKARRLKQQNSED